MVILDICKISCHLPHRNCVSRKCPITLRTHLICSENKGADQLHSYCTANLSLCFRTCKMQVYSRRSSIYFQGEMPEFMAGTGGEPEQVM